MLTVDVEPDWGCTGTSAVRQILPRFCELLEKYAMPATFFVVADLLDTCAEGLRLVGRSHEIASHGLTHRRLDRLSEAAVDSELQESRRRLRDELGREVNGFRAPFFRRPFSAGSSSKLFERLSEVGYGYDSSVGHAGPSVRNIPPAKWRVEARGGVAEIPTTTLRTGVIPFCLTYLRLLAPLGERLIPADGAVFYLHLHELADPKLARVLPAPLRWALRRGAGPRAWRIIEGLIRHVAPRAVTCGEFLRDSRSAAFRSARL